MEVQVRDVHGELHMASKPLSMIAVRHYHCRTFFAHCSCKSHPMDMNE
jgi:hypothetical protein